MTFAKISQVAHYAPSQVISNQDLSERMDTSDEWIASRTGIRKRHITQSESTSDLATEVARRLLEKSGLQADQLDFIIVATISPDSMMPSTAARVQAKIGASTAFVALATAEKLLRSGQYKRGIVIGSETLSKVIDWEDRTTAVLFGDGAGGVLLEASEQQTFLAESLFSDGSRGEVLQSSSVGLSSPYSDKEEDKKYLSMDGRAVFDFAIRDVAKSIKHMLANAPVAVDEIDYFLLHQANDRILDKMAKKIGVDREKLPANMMEYGNTSAASIPILLSECVDQGLIKLDGSQIILLSGFGGGLTWGSLLVTI